MKIVATIKAFFDYWDTCRDTRKRNNLTWQIEYIDRLQRDLYLRQWRLIQERDEVGRKEQK